MNEEEEAAARAELLTAQLAAAKADRTIKLNDFTGDNVPFINWMQHVNMSIAAAAWSQETSATRVQLALKGRAGVWFQNQLVLGVEGLDVWYPPEMGGVRPPNLLTLMEQRFHKAMSPLEQCNLRSTLTQKENEDSQNFFDRVVSVQLEFDKSLPLTFKIESKAAYTIGHNQAVFTNFVCGLRSEIRAHVTTAQATTVPDACRAAAAYELGAISKKPKAATGSVLGMESQNAYGADSLVSQIAALTASFRGGQGGRGRGSRGGSQRQQQANTQDDNSVPYCLYCGYVGHQRPKCNIKKKDEAAGLYYDKSPSFSPGRVGKSSRGRGGRGQSGRGQVHEMGNTGDTGRQQTSSPWHTATMPPPQTQQLQTFQLPQQQLQQQPQSQTAPQPGPIYYSDHGGASAFSPESAFRHFPPFQGN